MPFPSSQWNFPALKLSWEDTICNLPKRSAGPKYCTTVKGVVSRLTAPWKEDVQASYFLLNKVWPPLVVVVFRKRGKSPSWKRAPRHFVAQSFAVSTARFLFSSLEKYVIGIYICLSGATEGQGESWSMCLHLLRVMHVLHLPACLLWVWFVRYVLKNKSKNIWLPRLIHTYFSFIFLCVSVIILKNEIIKENQTNKQ